MTLSKENSGILKMFFQEHWDYISKLGSIFALTTVLFFFSIFMGYSLGDQISPQSFEGVLSNIPDPTSSTGLEMFTAILYNNILASFIFLVSGLIIGIPPLMFMAFNGFFVGYVSFNAAKTQGIWFVILTLLPHGVIEIPTILLCAAMGVGFGYKIIHKLNRRNGLQKYFAESIKVFIKRVVPLLVLAAGIETALIYALT